MLIINWIRKTQSCHNLLLLPLLEYVIDIVATFDSTSLTHVYKECNEAVDRLSKKGLQLANELMKVCESNGGAISKHMKQPML
jgi:hypothetical protein